MIQIFWKVFFINLYILADKPSTESYVVKSIKSIDNRSTVSSITYEMSVNKNSIAFILSMQYSSSNCIIFSNSAV